MNVNPDQYHIRDDNTIVFWLRTRLPEHECCFVGASERRAYLLDVRINPWTREDWKPEWPRYSNHHYYYDKTVYKYRDRILHIGEKTIRTKRFLLPNRKRSNP